MAKFRLLKLSEVTGQTALRAFNTFGVTARATDFVNLIGGYVTDLGSFYWLMDKKASIPPSIYYISDIYPGGIPQANKCDYSSYAIRPVIHLDDISNYNVISNDLDTMIIEYGEFPQTIEKTDISKMLEALYQLNDIERTSKGYTISDLSRNEGIDNKPFVPRTYPEMTLSNKRYVRIIAQSKCICNLSDGRAIENKTPYWVKVEPIRWIVDKLSGVCVSQCALVSGIPFSHSTNYSGYFNESDISKYFEFYFSDEVIKQEVKKPKEKKIKITDKSKQTPYGFVYSNVTEEDIIKAAVMADIAVFLHGKSSDGKSARVKAIDPDCEIIYLRNATPESLNGKSVYNSMTGEMIDIPPTWYKRVMEKCEAHPERIHIVFLDEITNALHSIQGMAFNIVLNKEVNGIWKLPDNVRIVAAGNDIEDSLAANTLAEPLFNRFAHVYITTNAKGWLSWATENNDTEYLEYQPKEKKSKIHPAVYAYIATRGDAALRTPYTGKKPNADPRKWELASKLLYSCNKPMMIRALVGADIAKDFCTCCKQNKISIADVILGKYNMAEVKGYDISKKYLLVLAMSLVDDLYLATIRAFVKNLEPELVGLFDTYWIANNPDKIDALKAIIDGE